MNKKLNTKIISCIIVIILLMLVFSGCSTQSIENNEDGSIKAQKVGFSNITPEESKQRLDSGEEIILLDVRTKEEYEAGHIKDAILIPLDKLKEDAEKNLMDKETPIFVYCRSGNRSVSAAKILVELGYINVYNLGGIIDWPYEVVK